MRELLVVKIGTTTLLDDEEQLDQTHFDSLAAQMIGLNQAYDIVIVTSAAISAGAEEMSVDRRRYSNNYPYLRHLASVGQPLLMVRWRGAFQAHKRLVGQFVVTRYELGITHERTSFTETIKTAVQDGTIPVVNENDAIADDEIKIGDNDQLSGRLAAALSNTRLWSKVSLIILSDVDAFYSDYGTSNKRKESIVSDIEHAKQHASGTGSSHGTGGMLTKLLAAEQAGTAGVEVYLSHGKAEDTIARALAGEIGTHFVAKKLVNR
jgi:glutamate 5-kinase